MNNINLLLSRLTWPSALVRERTAVALAELISLDDSIGNQVRKSLLEWIARQGLESTAIIGILVFCRLADQNSSLLPKQDELNDAIQKPSLLSFALMQHLYGSGAMKPSWDTCHSSSVAADFEPIEFFERNRTHFLPLIFSHNIEFLQSRTMLLLFRQWAFEWTQIVASEGMQPSESVSSFGMRSNSPRIVVDFLISEAYRSAYLRCIAWATTRGKLSEEDGISLALDACPIDLGIWRVQPGTIPNWWPIPKTSAGEIDTVPAQTWAAMSNVWESRRSVFDEKVLLAAEGRVFQSGVVYDLSIRAMFQVAHGPVPGEPAEIMEGCEAARGSQSNKGVCFGGLMDPVDPTDVGFSTGDWSVLPASISVRPGVFSRWQYWRGHGATQLPAPFLASKNLSINCEPESIKAYDDSIEIGSWHDWTNGVTEEFDVGLTYPYGWVLEVPWKLIDDFLQESPGNFGWICELKGFSRAHEYEPYKEFFKSQQIFGTTNLILPR